MPELVVSWIVIGLVAGILVWLFSPRSLSGGLFTNVVAGIAAAAAGGFIIGWLTGADVITDKLTWGILTVTALAALITLAALQIQGRPRSSN